MDQLTIKPCTKCGELHQDPTKWCPACKEKKKQDRDNYYKNPEALLKRREAAKVWKKKNPDKVKDWLKQGRVNRRQQAQLQALPHVGDLINQLEYSVKYANENEYELATVLLPMEDINFIIEILKQVVTITEVDKTENGLFSGC